MGAGEETAPSVSPASAAAKPAKKDLRLIVSSSHLTSNILRQYNRRKHVVKSFCETTVLDAQAAVPLLTIGLGSCLLSIRRF